MDKNNINYLHLFICGVVVVFTVYAGEQISRCPNGSSSWLFRSESIAAFVSILSFGLSFIPVIKNKAALQKRTDLSKKVSLLYYFDGKEVEQISKDAVLGIQECNQRIGELIMIQYITDKIGKWLTYCAFVFAILSSLLFCAGVFLL